MTPAEIIELFKTGAAALAIIAPGGAAAEELLQLESIVQDTIQAIAAINGEPIEDVVSRLTFENPDPEV